MYLILEQIAGQFDQFFNALNFTRFFKILNNFTSIIKFFI